MVGAHSPRRRLVSARNSEETAQVDLHGAQMAQERREIVTLSTRMSNRVAEYNGREQDDWRAIPASLGSHNVRQGTHLKSQSQSQSNQF